MNTKTISSHELAPMNLRYPFICSGNVLHNLGFVIVLWMDSIAGELSCEWLTQTILTILVQLKIHGVTSVTIYSELRNGAESSYF